MELVEVPVGSDSSTAQFLSDVCTGEGVTHELILGTDPYLRLSRSASHRLLVRYDDLPLVEQIIGDHFPGLLDHDPIEHVRPTRSAGRRQVRLLVGVPLLAVALATILALLVVLLQVLL